MHTQKTLHPEVKAEPTKLIDSITLDDAYYYKGSSNCNMLVCTMNDGTIHVFSQYGELMKICTSVMCFANFLHSLMEDEFA